MELVVATSSPGLYHFVMERVAWDVEWLQEGQEALVRCQKQQPHMVLLDWRLPGAATLAKWAATRVEIHCLAFLPNDEKGSLKQALDADIDAWIWWSSKEAPTQHDATAHLHHFIKKYESFLQKHYAYLKFAKTVEHASDAVEITDLDIRWEYVNHAFAALSGYTREEAIGHTPKELLFSGFHGPAHYKGIMDETVKGGLWRGGHISRRKDNTLSFQENTITRIYNERGDAIGTVALKRDLFHSRFADMHSESSNTLRDWIRDATDGLILFDCEEHLIDANATACAQLGYRLSELTKLPMSALDMGYEEGQIASWFASQPAHVDFFYSTDFRRKDGSTFAALLRLCVLPLGNATFLVASIRDVSELKQAQKRLEQLNKELLIAKDEAIEASQAKSMFLASMSHELRTPLNAVIGYAQLLKEELGEDGNMSYLPDIDNIEVSASHLLALINNILDLSKIEADKIDLNLGHVHLGELVGAMESTITPIANKEGNTLTCEILTEQKYVYTDRLRLSQVLLNILGNACKFTKDGVIEMKVSSEQVLERHDLLFSVRDTGVGMAPEKLKELFEPFVQIHRRTGLVQEHGTGLGLAISRRLCRVMGGELTVESVLGEGTTFVIRVPLSGPASASVSASVSE